MSFKKKEWYWKGIRRKKSSTIAHRFIIIFLLSEISIFLLQENQVNEIEIEKEINLAGNHKNETQNIWCLFADVTEVIRYKWNS
jgi:hypothetical protein